MKVEKDTVVGISYQLRTEEGGEIKDEATKEAPFEFLVGHNNVLELFEANLIGKSVGDRFSFVLAPADGYGEYDNEAKVVLQKSDFLMEGEDASHLIEIGNVIPLQDNFGNPHQGRITEIGDTDVTIDMNHPFAGKTLYFSGEIVSVRPAHESELTHGHVHSHGDHSHH